MKVNTIRNEDHYLATLREVSRLIEIDPTEDSPEGKRLHMLGTLVQAYEAEHYPIDRSPPN
jgi:HTH-type transcriptional regulator/antitoxin HigA